MSNIQPNCCLKFDFQKVDQHAGGKWLIHDTKRRKGNQLQAWNSPADYPSWVARCDIKGCVSTVLNPIFSKKVQGQKHPGRWGIVEHQISSIKMLFKTNTNIDLCKHQSTIICSFPWATIHQMVTCLIPLGLRKNRSLEIWAQICLMPR